MNAEGSGRVGEAGLVTNNVGFDGVVAADQVQSPPVGSSWHLSAPDLEADWHPPGTYTNDTQMSLAVARALVRAGHQPLDDLVQVMADEFVQWNRSPDNDRAPGHTCRAGCDNLETGVPWRESGVAESKGCGSAVRTAPIGLYFHDDEHRLIEVARASSLPTYGHPTALAAAASTEGSFGNWACTGTQLPRVSNWPTRRQGQPTRPRVGDAAL